MSRNRRQGGVRGPASALTSFLAGLGVEPAAGLTTWGNTSDITAQANEQPDHVVDPAGAVTARNVEAGPTEVGEGTPEAGPSGTGSVATDDIDDRPTKRARATSVDSDDLDADAPPTPPAPARSNGKAPSAGVKPEPLKAAGEFMPCGECTKRFTVTAYTKEHPKQPSTWLCVQCCYALGINPFEKVKKSKAKAAPQKKEDRAKIVHYDAKKGTLALSEICINIIGQYIEDVDQLGDIGSVNLDKVCRIISKSRKLAPETAGLFYSIDRKNLAMYDCTRLLPESFLTLANLCPNLETLKLDLCGQLSTDGLKHWGQNLKQLHRLELLGPFLVRKDGWNEFFQSVGSRLTGILVTQSPRIDLEVIQTLVDNCPDLVELRLSEVGQMCDELAAPLAKLSKLESLDLSAPGTSLNDVAVIALLSSIGGNLKHLNLNDNTELSDDILPAILDHCTELRSLHLKNLALTDTAVAEFFTSLSAKGRHGLSVIDLEKGHDLGDAALKAVIKHSGSTVENLSILGWRTASKGALEQLAKCSAMRELNIGWCREVTDFVIKDILDGCEHLKSMRVWGCNQLTDAVPRKKGVKVIGIESHTI